MRALRADPGKRILYLSLVCLINLSVARNLVVASGDGERVISGNRLIDELETGPDLSVGPSPADEFAEADEENEVADGRSEGANDSNKHAGRAHFTWSHHSEDHGIYAGRSLISSANIKPSRDLYVSDKDETEEGHEEVESVASGKLRKSMGVDDEHQDDPLRTIDYAEKEWQLMFRAFDAAASSGLSSSVLQEVGKQTNLFEEIVSRLRPQCRRDIYHVRDSIKRHKLWALRMVDANGKLPSGITYGRFASPGDYEECLSIQVNDKLYKDVKNDVVVEHKFHGKYCLMDFRLPLPERPPNKLLSVHESVLNFTNTELGRHYPDLIGNYSAYASVFYEVGYNHGFCLPSSCDEVDLARAMTKAFEGMYLIVNNTVDCEERPPGVTKPLRASQWISIGLLTFVFANALLASIAYHLLPEHVKRPGQQRGPSAAAAAAKGQQQNAGGKQRDNQNNQNKGNLRQSKDLSGVLQDTLKQLTKLEEVKRVGKITKRETSLRQKLIDLSVANKFFADCFSIQTNFERLTKPDPRGLTFVHYTRIVAMALTVITHTGALGTLQAIIKPADASNSEQIFRDLIPQMLANAFTSIQIFFFMAGFMLVISTYPSIKRDKGHLSFLEYAVKRAIRLLPGIVAAICINFIWPLLVDGPMISYFDRVIVATCETNWWHTMMFVSNFDHVEKMCLRHSYFSASDYQLHIMAFPLLILLYKQPALSLFLAGILTVSGFVAQVIMILTKTVLPFMMVDYIDKEAFFNVVHYIHHPVWNHMSAFFYGFIVGYFVVKQIRIELSATTIKRVWWVMMPAGVASIFAPYFWNHYKRPIYKWQMLLYVIFDRFILLTTCAWLSYATMVLARKPPAKKAAAAAAVAVDQSPAGKQGARPAGQGGAIKSPIEQVLSKPAQTASLHSFDKPQAATSIVVSEPPEQRLGRGFGGSSGSLASLPRQRSSPNLATLQQQQQQQQQQQHNHQHHHHHMDLGSTLGATGGGRLSRTTSSSNLATIVESAQLPSANDKHAAGEQQAPVKQPQPGRPRAPPSVSNLNTLCLVLSRLTFQLYLFNMVVLWIDVNHSKYLWYFSYYFIIFKAAAIYICSAIFAMVFFVLMESPCLTLYIAWVKGRAAARAKRAACHARKANDLRIIVPPPLDEQAHQPQGAATTITVEGGPNHEHGEPVELAVATVKPALSYIDQAGSTPASPLKEARTNQAFKFDDEHQTKM